MRKFIAAPVVACGLLSAAIPFAGEASAVCDSADCVPNVARNVAEGAPCAPRPSYVFGLDAGRKPSSAPRRAVGRCRAVVGEREVALPCDRPGDTAQQPLAQRLAALRTPGVPLKCAEMNGAIGG